MKTLITVIVMFCLVGCQSKHEQPQISGKSEPVNSSEVMRNGI